VRFLVAIVLLLSFTPGISEVIEAAVNLVAQTDLLEHASDSDRDRPCDEHGCTPLAHHCSCHPNVSAQVASREVPAARIPAVRQLDPRAVANAAGRAYEPPPLRPPIA